jgi:hypothetical protein
MARSQRPICRRPRPPSIDANPHGALFAALGLASMPGFAQRAGRQPLPEGILELLEIAAGCDETLREAVALSGRDAQAVRAAAEFYLRHALFFEGADSFRLLGVTAGETNREEMRLHMRWLMIWLHPDHGPDPERAALAGRVLEAWRGHASERPSVPASGADIADDAERPTELEPPAPRVPARRDGSPLAAVLLAFVAIVLFVLALELGVGPDEIARIPLTSDETGDGFP